MRVSAPACGQLEDPAGHDRGIAPGVVRALSARWLPVSSFVDQARSLTRAIGVRAI